MIVHDFDAINLTNVMTIIAMISWICISRNTIWAVYLRYLAYLIVSFNSIVLKISDFFMGKPISEWST